MNKKSALLTILCFGTAAVLFTGCANMASTAQVIAKANAESKASVTLDVITPQGSLHYSRAVTATNAP